MKRSCLLKILLLWVTLVTVGCEKKSLVESTLLVPVTVNTSWPDQVVTELTPTAIQLLIKGTAEDLAALEQRTISYTIKQQPEHPGLHQIPIETALLLLPNNISAIKTTPATVSLKTETKAAKFVHITPRLEGAPATGWTISATTVEPNTASISGGESVLASLKEIFTDPIPIDNISETLDQPEVKLVVPEGVVLVGPESVAVTIHLDVERVTRTWPDLKVSLRGDQYAATVRPNKVTLTVRGPQVVLDQLNEGRQVELFVDAAGLEPGVYVRRATIRLPMDVMLEKAEPTLFTITLSNPK